MKRYFIPSALLSMLAAGGSFSTASANSVAFSENFNGDYSENFPLMFDLDHLPPLSNVGPLFMDNEGVARPWWKIKDSSASQEAFIASHAAYQKGGTSNDWLVSRPIEIPTEGFVLTFDAQSYVMRSGERLSDLRVYLTENPVTADNLPDTPALHIPNVPEGNYREDIENDFTSYSLPLDEYAGKTIWLSFANLNEDKDILVVDNVLVQRPDPVELSANSAEYSVEGEYVVECDLTVTGDEAISDWMIAFEAGDSGEIIDTYRGEPLAAGLNRSFSFTDNVSADECREWRVVFSAPGVTPVVAEGVVEGLLFMPERRVLLEETTGTWCGNCPIGMYAMEQMILDEEMGEKIVPVSVHISGSGRPDYMEVEEYAYLFGVNSAPALRIDRNPEVTYFSMAHDGAEVDWDNPLSVAHAVRQRQQQPALFDIGIEGELSADLSYAGCRVTLRAAKTLEGGNYALGFILTENNVSLPDNPLWYQENYTSGVAIESGLGGFTSMPEKIPGWKYQDVARAVYGYRGYEEAPLPGNFGIGTEYEVEVSLPLPDTYLETEGAPSAMILSPALVRENLSVVAYLLDLSTGRIVNCAEYPLGANGGERTTIAQQYENWKASSVDVTTLDSGAAGYYDMAGRRIERPGKGIYVVKRGDKVTKEVVR